MSEQKFIVNTGCFRYIVPFSYKGSFEDAFRLTEEQKDKKDRRIWLRSVSGEQKGESDLYRYIRDEIYFDSPDGELSEEKSGCEWKYLNLNGSIRDLCYFENKLTARDDKIPHYMQFSVSDLGLILYRNNMGFLWYELKLPTRNGELDSETLIVFQNRARELNYPYLNFWEKCSSKPDFGIVELDDGRHKKYIEPFVFGKWITDCLSFLDVAFFAERRSVYDHLLKDACKIPGFEYNEELLADINEKTQSVPDKAVLFTYASLSETDGNVPDRISRYSVTYHLTNGYKNSYKFSEELINEMKSPFGNVIWYATHEGAAYMAWPDEDNMEFFKASLLPKIRSDYFLLYLKVLYHLYSLFTYSRILRETVSAVKTSFSDEEPDEGISRIFSEVNLFLTKNLATSVSHIDHQSEFYIYLNKRLHIKDNIESISSGLNALDTLKRDQWQRAESRRSIEAWEAENARDREAAEIARENDEREKARDSKIQAIMGLLAVLSIFSALVDSFDFFGRVFKGSEWGEIPPIGIVVEGVCIIVIIVVSILALVFAIKAIRTAFRQDKDK